MLLVGAGDPDSQSLWAGDGRGLGGRCSGGVAEPGVDWTVPLRHRTGRPYEF